MIRGWSFANLLLLECSKAGNLGALRVSGSVSFIIASSCSLSHTLPPFPPKSRQQNKMSKPVDEASCQAAIITCQSLLQIRSLKNGPRKRRSMQGHIRIAMHNIFFTCRAQRQRMLIWRLGSSRA